MSQEKTFAKKWEFALNNLLIFQEIKTNPVVTALRNFFQSSGATKLQFFSEFNSLLLTQTTRPLTGTNLWQSFLIQLILESENLFSAKAASTPWEAIDHLLQDTVTQDLRLLKTLYDIDWSLCSQTLLDGGMEQSPLTEFKWPVIHRLENKTEIDPISKTLIAESDWGQSAPALAEYFYHHGYGLFGKYWAFRWESDSAGGRLEPVISPDPIRLSQLVGYERQKGEVVKNTWKFIKGYPANNLLLYGDRGTGKSSTVKGLLHDFGSQGLRLIEMPKKYLSDLPKLMRILRSKPQKFLLFIDDLSFEETERDFKELKALLEGSLEARPDNILVYATSNRRHLIKEKFADRKEGLSDDDVRSSDTIQEKLSLADRFGMTIIYPTPDKQEYLTIVEELAKELALPISLDELHRQALQWELWHNGRSARTARQFIDYLHGELMLTRDK